MCVRVFVSDCGVTVVLLGVVGVHVYACLCLFVWTVRSCMPICVHGCMCAQWVYALVCVCRRRMCAWCGSVRPHMPVIDTLFVDCVLFSLALCLRSLHFLSICC